MLAEVGAERGLEHGCAEAGRTLQLWKLPMGVSASYHNDINT
jgi:hypothetical protein